MRRGLQEGGLEGMVDRTMETKVGGLDPHIKEIGDHLHVTYLLDKSHGKIHGIGTRSCPTQ